MKTFKYFLLLLSFAVFVMSCEKQAANRNFNIITGDTHPSAYKNVDFKINQTIPLDLDQDGEAEYEIYQDNKRFMSENHFSYSVKPLFDDAFISVDYRPFRYVKDTIYTYNQIDSIMNVRDYITESSSGTLLFDTILITPHFYTAGVDVSKITNWTHQEATFFKDNFYPRGMGPIQPHLILYITSDWSYNLLTQNSDNYVALKYIKNKD
ncbi:MAG: hypothetical protein HYZ42_05470 [Bacteroidetes bacterium]|nr:hypothetical protein [Bacteroidota bacterium]